MSKIRIKNFGPIKSGYQENDGWMDIKKVSVFIGDQGSGKSTVAKLISSFTWMEKALVRGDYTIKELSKKNKLRNQFLKYHRLENYLRKSNSSNKTEVEYTGDAYNIKYKNEILYVNENRNNRYPLPQIMYVPAERNFISYVKSPKELKLSSDSLKEFLTEFDNAKNDLKGMLKLPINDVEIEFDKLNDTVNLKKGEEFKLKLTETSSGFQSIVPLYMVSRFLSNTIKNKSESTAEPMSGEELERFRNGVANIWSNVNLTDEQRRVALSVLSSKFNKTAFINIVEEPEQNLYPTSQKKMLESLLEFNNKNEGNKLIITTHSPYLINYLTLAVKASTLKDKIQTDNLRIKLERIVPLASTIKPDDLIIYELNEESGSIKKLDIYDGLPSDENELNEKLGESNELFAQLLEIQQIL